MIALARDWLERAGAKLAPGVAVEISPTWALESHDVLIKPGCAIDTQHYFV